MGHLCSHFVTLGKPKEQFLYEGIKKQSKKKSASIKSYLELVSIQGQR